MGRMTVHVWVTNILEPDKTIECDALVDTGSAHLVFPTAWEGRLGKLRVLREVDCVTATQQTAPGRVCGPVEIRMEGFQPVAGEVLFLDMVPKDGTYEPLVGYIPLEASQAAVDMLGHRLIHVKATDLKPLGLPTISPIPPAMYGRARQLLEAEFSSVPFRHRGIWITQELVGALIEILNSAPNRTLPQNCRNRVRAETPDGLDRRIKERLNTDQRTANIISDVLTAVGIVDVLKVTNGIDQPCFSPCPTPGRTVKGTRLRHEWCW